MSDFIFEDARLFMEALSCGVIIAIIYDAIRLFRWLVPHHNLFINIEDFIFWNFSGLYFFAVMFSTNDGVIRGFFLIGAIIGAYLYFNLVDIILKKPVNKVIIKLKKRKEKADGKKHKKKTEGRKYKSDNWKKTVK